MPRAPDASSRVRSVTAKFSDDELAWVDRACGGRSRSEWLRALALDAAVPRASEVARRSPAAVPACDHPRGRVIKGFCYRCGRMVA
jgi:hypothetical protein